MRYQLIREKRIGCNIQPYLIQLPALLNRTENRKNWDEKQKYQNTNNYIQEDTVQLTSIDRYRYCKLCFKNIFANIFKY